MKWFPDDYHKVGIEKTMIIYKGFLHRFELFHIDINSGWRPFLDLYETEQDLVVLVELAGMQADDVEINVGRERVQLRGNRCRPSEHKVTRVHHMEIEFGPYDQMIALPEPVDPNGSTSTYRDGFLIIRLPKEVKSLRLDQ
ncbi:MAG: Hsp20/alpha crystallin family protein [Deltaproteobacteria bacterium]|nr:MAG: Hsp20/alpha crystallin family protein [Deltaproteobacteria bacterium]